MKIEISNALIVQHQFPEVKISLERGSIHASRALSAEFESPRDRKAFRLQLFPSCQIKVGSAQLHSVVLGRQSVGGTAGDHSLALARAEIRELCFAIGKLNLAFDF